MKRTTFTAVGHVCHDVAPNGYLIGGAAAYSTITARNLGAASRIVTAVGDDFDLRDPLLDGIEISAAPSQETTTFHNTYQEGRRTQRLLSVGAPLTGESMPPAWGASEITYLCPIADEVRPSVLGAISDGIIGATPQGWLRAWKDDKLVYAKRWESAEAFLPRVDALVLSEEDVAPFPDELDRYRANVKRMIVTHGKRGAVLFEQGEKTHFDAYPANEVDATGAGDVFACSFLMTFAHTRDAHLAMDFANCVASFAVEGVGTGGIPTREQVAERWGRPAPFGDDV